MEAYNFDRGQLEGFVQRDQDTAPGQAEPMRGTQEMKNEK
jgi:hypothetical protein